MQPTKLLRTTVGLSQAALAERAGTSQSTIAAYERGSKQPGWGTLERMARRVGMEALVWFAPPMLPADRHRYVLHMHAVDEYRARPELVRHRLGRELVRLAGDRPEDRATVALWEVLLDGPVPDLAWTMLDPGEFGRTLRRASPFPRVVSPATRLIATGAGTPWQYRHRRRE
jgi:transcriptional regulator with XRE-family HTH domain